MEAARTKVIKREGQEPDDLELSISQALQDLQENSDLRTLLLPLHITGAKEIDAQGQKAVIIRVPVPQLGEWQRIQTCLVPVLQAKFSGKLFVFIAQRRILPQENRNGRSHKQKRPRSRTLTAVHDNILHDLCFPAEIVGKRTCHKPDGSVQIKVHLDKKQQPTLGHMVGVFSAAYKKLTGKYAAFQFVDSEFYNSAKK